MQHYQRNVAGITKYCPTCNRLTLHRIDDRRVGPCTEQHATGMSRAQIKRAVQKDHDEQNPNLF